MIPADFKFKMPPEWCKHQRTFMAWPLQEALWPEPFTDILPAFANIVKTISSFEPVTVIAKPDQAQQAADFCGPEIEILPLDHNDSWLRDSGPTFVVNHKGEIAGINWIFNAWGNKYTSTADNLVAPGILKHYKIPCFDAPFVMEGGSIHVDGEGTLLTTEECLLNKNRNPNLNKKEIENLLHQFLGVNKFIWLKRGWVGDDTDGHIDNIACFASPEVIITQICSDTTDPNYAISQENLFILKEATNAQGRPFKIVTIEQPPVAYYEDMRLTLSYLNFYFVNGGIILPVFGGNCLSTDQAAKQTLEKVFPDRKIVTVDGSIIVRGGGNIHCLTQQMPAKIQA